MCRPRKKNGHVFLAPYMPASGPKFWEETVNIPAIRGQSTKRQITNNKQMTTQNPKSETRSMVHPRVIRRVGNVAAATSRVSGAQELAAWLQPADEDHQSLTSSNWERDFARRAGILADSSTKRQRADPATNRAAHVDHFTYFHASRHIFGFFRKCLLRVT